MNMITVQELCWYMHQQGLLDRQEFLQAVLEISGEYDYCAGAVLVHAPAGAAGQAGVPAGCTGDGGEVQESRGSALQAPHANFAQATDSLLRVGQFHS